MTPTQWLPIKYRDFYDVPRIFVVEDAGAYFLFDCPFDEKADEYPKYYVVYRLTPETGEALDDIQDWGSLPKKGQRVDKINVADVQFDETKRKFVDSRILNQLR